MPDRGATRPYAVLRGRRPYADGGPTRTAALAGGGPTRAARVAHQRVLLACGGSPRRAGYAARARSRGPGLCPRGWNRCRAPSCHRFVPPGPGNYGAGLFVAVLAAVEAPADPGGRRLDAKRPEKRGAGGFASGPRFLFGRPRGGPQGRPSAAKRRRPPHSPPGRTAGAAAFFRAGADGPGHEKQARCRAKPGSGRVGCAHPPPPPHAGVFHQRQVERQGKGAQGLFMVRLACVDLAGPVELFQQHHPKELVGKGGRPKGDALIRPGPERRPKAPGTRR